MARQRDESGNSVWRPFNSNLIPDELAGNVYRLARALAAQGHSADYIRDRLGGRKRATDLATVERATNLAMTWADRMREINAQGGNAKIPRAYMTRNDLLREIPTAYRWIVQIELVGKKMRGGGRYPSEYRTVAVNSDKNLTLDEIGKLAAAIWEKIMPESPPGRRVDEGNINSLILTAERRSG